MFYEGDEDVFLRDRIISREQRAKILETRDAFARASTKLAACERQIRIQRGTSNADPALVSRLLQQKEEAEAKIRECSQILGKGFA